MSDAAAILIDARGMRCPWPALRMARAARAAATGTHFRLLADDPLAAGEMIALAGARGWRIVVEPDRYDVWT